uniref:Transposase-associated domain-containing protein n=1 Tax=Cucumis melo TaxID=3656 RepID=A0A9I9E4R4_CUCME
MDKSWMKIMNKFFIEYRERVTQFLEVVKFHVDAYGRIRCPCKRCINLNSNSIEVWNDIYLLLEYPLLHRMSVLQRVS